MVLEAVPLPTYFPEKAEATYSPHGEQAVLQFELPGPDVVPATRAVQYVQSRDEHRELPRPTKESGELYRLVISQIALLCLHDIFAADSTLESVAFNGHVWATNPATGQREYPCLISLKVDRGNFAELVLEDVRPDVCLRHLRALVSLRPYDLEAIKPIVDFDLSKYRFIEGLDAVSTLDSRRDLMDLTPDEFEHLVRQVFEATGLEGWTTAHSKDDGVDAVMVNKTPGGAMLCIVQGQALLEGRQCEPCPRTRRRHGRETRWPRHPGHHLVVHLRMLAEGPRTRTNGALRRPAIEIDDQGTSRQGCAHRDRPAQRSRPEPHHSLIRIPELVWPESGSRRLGDVTERRHSTAQTIPSTVVNFP